MLLGASGSDIEFFRSSFPPKIALLSVTQVPLHLHPSGTPAMLLAHLVRHSFTALCFLVPNVIGQVGTARKEDYGSAIARELFTVDGSCDDATLNQGFDAALDTLLKTQKCNKYLQAKFGGESTAFRIWARREILHSSFGLQAPESYAPVQ